MSGPDNLKIRRGDFWRQPLDNFDVVYAFLSPAPMPRWCSPRGPVPPPRRRPAAPATQLPLPATAQGDLLAEMAPPVLPTSLKSKSEP